MGALSLVTTLALLQAPAPYGRTRVVDVGSSLGLIDSSDLKVPRRLPPPPRLPRPPLRRAVP